MKLGEVISLGLSEKKRIENDKDYVIAGVQSYGKGVVNRRIETGKDLKMKDYQKIDRDFLMWCKVDTKNGAFGITKDEHIGSLASTNMCLAQINRDKISPQFLERLFRFDFFHEYITHLSSGSTNRKYLTPKQLCQMVELPDLNIYQQEVFLDLASKIENNELLNELSNQLNLIKQIRQSFLREAMQGKLLEVKPNGKTGQQLLEKIKAEKAKLIAEKKIKKEKELLPINKDEIPFEIPEHWAWCRLGEISEVGTGATPLTSNRDYYTNGNIPWITSSSTNNLFVETPELYITEKALKETNCKIYPAGTLVVAMYGQGKTRGQITEMKFSAATNQACATITFHLDDFYLRKFVKLFFQKIYDEIRLLAQGGAQPNLNMGKIKATIIPLPPLHEQEQIVAKLDELMAFCDGLETSIKESKQYNEMLLQQVLKEALSGEKVDA